MSHINTFDLKDKMNEADERKKLSEEEENKPILFDERPSGDNFPVEYLPDGLNLLISDLSKHIQAPLAMCAQSVLACIALVAQPHIDIRGFGSVHPSSLFFITLGESGIRKSTVDRYVMREIKEYERELDIDFEREHNKYLENVSRIEKGKIDTLIKPYRKQILSDDITTEGLISSFVNGSPTRGIFTDEGAIVLGGYSMNAENKMKSSAYLCKLWSGDKIAKSTTTIDVVMYGKRMSMHIMIQPELGRSFLGDESLKNQGLLSRCLASYPPAMFGERKIKLAVNNFSISIIEECDSYQKFNKRLRSLLRIPYCLDPELKLALLPRKISFDEKSLKKLSKFHDEEIEPYLKDGQKYQHIRGFASKSLENIQRLAAVLAWYKDENLTYITIDYVNAAIQCQLYYLEQILSFDKTIDLKTTTIDKNHELAQELYQWMLAKKEEKDFKQKGFSLRSFQRSAPLKFRKNPHAIQLYLDILLDRRLIYKNPSSNYDFYMITEFKK